MTRVVNKKTDAFDIYIGRPGCWGNPFVMKDQTKAERKRVIAAYDKWLDTRPELLSKLPELVGKTLGCFCTPKECHGDILVRRCNELVLASRTTSINTNTNTVDGERKSEGKIDSVKSEQKNLFQLQHAGIIKQVKT